MWELHEAIQKLVNDYLADIDAVEVSAEAVGLDPRCGNVWVSTQDRWIAVSGNSRIDYYGGFEYIDHDLKDVIGDMTFYCGDASRVEDALEFYIEHQNSQGEE